MDQIIKIAIIEDHLKIRNGIEYMLKNYSNFICQTFTSAEEALSHFKTDVPDVVLMDIGLPGMDGIECTRRIKSDYPKVQIMMCTVYEDDEKIFKALTAGANGYILKHTAGELLIQSIKELYNGGAPMSSSIAKKVVLSFQHKPQKAANVPMLTDRENEVLDLLAQGYRNKEISDKLNVSVNTVRTHIYNIYEKLHVQNRVEALNKTGRLTGE